MQLMLLKSNWLTDNFAHCLKLIVFNMKKNVGTADRIIRITLAVIFAVLFFTGTVTGTVGYVLLALAAIFLVTSIVTFCPLYLPFGLSTCKKD